MALIDRVIERTETDLTTAPGGELALMIAEFQAQIQELWGPDRDVDAPITVGIGTHYGDKTVNLNRPLDGDEPVAVSEYAYDGPETVLDADDFRVWYGGRTIERLNSGANPTSYWASRVEVSYVPKDDQRQRDEAVIELCILTIEYKGIASQKVGDAWITDLNYDAEREKILTRISPRRGLLIA